MTLDPNFIFTKVGGEFTIYYPEKEWVENIHLLYIYYHFLLGRIYVKIFQHRMFTPYFTM